jgi:hypothetical protein
MRIQRQETCILRDITHTTPTWFPPNQHVEDGRPALHIVIRAMADKRPEDARASFRNLLKSSCREILSVHAKLGYEAHSKDGHHT